MIASLLLPYLGVFIVGLLVGRIGAYVSGMKYGITETTKQLSVGNRIVWFDTCYSKPKCDCHILLASENLSTMVAATYDHTTDKVYTNIAPDGEVIEWKDLSTWAYDKYCPIKKIEEK